MKRRPTVPLMDGFSAAVKKMIARGKERGYITYDELNAALPQTEMSSEQIEDTMAMLNEIGINLVESDDQEEGTAAEKPAAAAAASGEEEEAASAPPAISTTTISAAPTIPCACICARWAPSSCSPARARSPSPSASRPAAT